MVDLRNLVKKKNDSFLFIPVSVTQEFLWLLKRSGINYNDFKVYQWRAVSKNQVPAVKHLTENEKRTELENYYGEAAEGMMKAATVIVSKYDKDEIFGAFKETLIGNGDADYKAYDLDEQAYANENMEEAEGITVAKRSR